MDLKQTNDFNMIDATLQTMTKYNGTWSGNAIVVAAVNSVQSNVGTLNSMDQLQKATSKGITLTKEQAKINMVDLAFAHVSAGKAYAVATNNLTLQASLKYTISDLKRFKDTDANNVCQTIHDAVSPVIASLTSYGANATTLTNLQNDINTYAGLIGKPRSQVSAKAAATKSVAQIISQTKTILKNTLDPLMEQYKTSNAAFYKEYHTSRIIVNIGTHKETFLEGVVTDGTNPLENVTVKVTGTKKHKLTKKNGKFRFMYLEPQKYTVTATAQGYINFSENVMLTKDEANKITIVMLPNKNGIVVA
jgi:hypothetical protein